MNTNPTAFLRSPLVFSAAASRAQDHGRIASPWVNLYTFSCTGSRREKKEKKKKNHQPVPNATLTTSLTHAHKHIRCPFLRLCRMCDGAGPRGAPPSGTPARVRRLATGLTAKQLSLPCLCNFCCSVKKKREKNYNQLSSNECFI